jgi:rhodanese-related sulfurtransferase
MKMFLLPIIALGLVVACNSPETGETADQVILETTAETYVDPPVDEPPVAEPPVAQDIDAEQFKEKLVSNENVQLVDVRTPEEWEQGVIGDPYKANINGPDFDAKLAALDKNKPVLVYCAAGGRSGRCMQIMEERGFKEVYNLEGGIKAWRQAGYEVSGN